jgi:hypothetical protein
MTSYEAIQTKNFGSVQQGISRKTNISMLAGGFKSNPKIFASNAYSKPSPVTFRTNYRGIP